MKIHFKIYQVNSPVNIQDVKTHSVYEHDLYTQLDGEEYNSKADAVNALNKFLNNNPDDDGEYVIWELYTK